MEPTAVGVVDLGRSITLSTPDGRAWGTGHRDALLLVRLHGEPLAVMSVDRDVGDIADDELAREVWRRVGAEIRQHVERFGCIHTPEGADSLLGALGSPSDVCSGSRPAKPGASVAVILCTVGRKERLERCIQSLLAQRLSDFELVVVDNRPETGEVLHTVGSIAKDDKRLRYVSERRTGLSVARNRGVSTTDAQLVAFTDDDVVVDPGWLEWLVAPFAEPAVTATSGMVLPLELQTEAQKRFEQFGGFSKGVERRTYDLRSGRAGGLLLYPFSGDIFGSGNSMAFRRAELVAAGGFDPALGAGSPADGGEDMYALTTAILRGGTIVYEPHALCWHEHRKDYAALQRQVFSYGTGFTATMTKALTSNPRFYTAAARSLPAALALNRFGHATPDKEAAGVDEAQRFPHELLRTHRRGIVRGPLRYAQGVIRARRMGLDDVIRGG
jgi:GT2 family glycosyltransferase